MTTFATIHGCADCGATQGVECAESCPSAAVVHAERVEAALDSASSTGRCCTSPLCPCRVEGVAA